LTASPLYRSWSVVGFLEMSGERLGNQGEAA